MFASLRSRLALSNLLITLLGLAVVVAVFTHLLTVQSTEVRKEDLAAQSRRIAARIERLYAQGASSEKLKQEVYTDSELLGVRIIVVSPDGRKRIVDSQEKTPFYSGSWHVLDQKALRNVESATAAIQRNSNLYRFQSPIHGTGGRNGGAVLLVARVADVQPAASSLLDVMVVAVGAAIAVWLFIGLYFTVSISRPLLRIARATNRMARGDYSARADVRGHGEIGHLGASFNEMAQQVQQSNRVLKDFLANVSHDLRTPLTMITGFSQALLDGTARQEEIAESASVIHEEALKMERLVDDLLQLTRLESGLLQLDRHPVQPRSYIQSIIDRVTRARAQTVTAHIENRVPIGLPLIEVDPERLERAITNLLNNALEHTPSSGLVAVQAAKTEPGWVEISITDTGSGIPRQDLPRIFERFYRSDRSRARLHGHSGLGLAIVREIVEAHGGDVTAESEPGRGSTFRLTVPAAVAMERERETRPREESVRPAATR